MSLFALTFNFGWEIVIEIYVADALPEQIVYGTWMALDLGLVYTMLKHGEGEWKHAPAVGRNLGKIFTVCLLWCCWMVWAFCDWWLDESNPVNSKPGKVYKGIEGQSDTTEMAYWSALVIQVVLSVMLLAQLIVRGHSGGASYSIWAARFNGSLWGLNAYTGYCYYAWPEAHECFVSPVSICLMVSWVMADLAYVIVLRQVKRAEVEVPGGGKASRAHQKASNRLGMASSDDDEDLQRALAMSMEGSQEQPVSLDSDDEDDDLRQAIALSLKETHVANDEDRMSNKKPPIPHVECAFPSPPATQNAAQSQPAASSTTTSGIFGLDRKAMEAERLARIARLGKRKRSTSPERPSKSATKPNSQPAALETESSRAAPSPLQYPRGAIKRTWAVKHPRQNDIKIEEVLQASTLKLAVLSAYDLDAHWLFTKFDPKVVKQVWIGSHKDKATQDQWRAEAASCGIKMHFPPMDGQIQISHGKLMLLIHDTHMRIVVSTANTQREDWGETDPDPRSGAMYQAACLENSVFLIDLPRRPNGELGKREDLTFFGQGLLQYLEALKLSDYGILKFDFSNTKHIAFVHSIAGVHTGKSREVTGLPGLSTALRALNLDEANQLELDYASASLGALKEGFLKHVYTAACSNPDLPYDKVPSDFLDRLRIYFPTHETVINSSGSKDCGGTITLNRAYYNAATFPKKILRQYNSIREGVLSHNKLLFARGHRTKEQTPFAWAYVGSANLSESAWGLQKTPKKGEKLEKVTLRNYECGVLIGVPTESIDKLELGTGAIPPMDVFQGALTLPFEYPGKTFEGKQPWLCE
ncbi:tyrosyl-DNA phosphodiesterase-domain-containing protein [Lophiotrema nucula]|uniref:Tyrosyl-DNA phosphodiesterase-domain-containing protein n=1 Tax=Lophiotrema nucula TaxID=690887 RepID=A0A6A5ZV62_9PLEO|nr:tyrosyl-DNA phosphodiesterase-domain-containing protein [Lophiotrema nucula]